MRRCACSVIDTNTLIYKTRTVNSHGWFISIRFVQSHRHKKDQTNTHKKDKQTKQKKAEYEEDKEYNECVKAKNKIEEEDEEQDEEK